MNNVDLFLFALKYPTDTNEIVCDLKSISDGVLTDTATKILNMDFLDQKYLSELRLIDITNVDKLKAIRTNLSNDWCLTYDRREISHIDLALNYIDFMLGNKTNFTNIIFYASNIYASKKIGAIKNVTIDIDIKIKFHVMHQQFREKIVKGVNLCH